MKKLFSIFAIFCMTLVSGIVLSACNDQDTYKIEIIKNIEESSLIDITLKIGSKKIDAISTGIYEVEKGSNVRVDITATSYGVDLSNLYVTLGTVGKNIIKNENYSVVPNKGELHFGYFLLSNISSNQTITFSGAELVSSTFTFEAINIEDESVMEKLKMTQINTKLSNNAEDFVEFYDFLSGENKSYTRSFDVSNLDAYKTFKLKFKGIRPFNFSENFPFQILDGNGIVSNIASMTLIDDDYYVVDLGSIGDSKNYTIKVDFSGVTFQQYNISKPDDNMTYTVSVDSEVIDFSQETMVTITKLLDATKADYTNMIVLLNSLQLEKVENSEINNQVKYTIPKGITPTTTGGRDVYQISVSGIEYLLDTYSLYANSLEENRGFSSFINPTLWAVDENGNHLSSAGVGSNGQNIAFAGERNAVAWAYNYDVANSCYRSVFDLYDYSIFANQVEILNVKQTLADAQEDLVVDLESGYRFRAFFNQTTLKFDRFQLEFVCNSDLSFDFKNFVLLNKNIDLVYNFDDARINKIEYAITNYDTSQSNSWQELRQNQSVRLSVTGKQVVMIRIGSLNDAIGTHEFKIADTLICNSTLTGEIYKDNRYNYTVFKFVVSDVQYQDSMEFKLIPAGSLG